MQHTEKSRSEYRILLGKPKGKTLLGRPGQRYDNNIKMNNNRTKGRKLGLSDSKHGQVV
jgi:hypothetical protein